MVVLASLHDAKYLPPKDGHDLLEADLVTTADLIRTIEVWIFAALASPLGLAVEKDSRSSLWVTHKVYDLNKMH